MTGRKNKKYNNGGSMYRENSAHGPTFDGKTTKANFVYNLGYFGPGKSFNTADKPEPK